MHCYLYAVNSHIQKFGAAPFSLFRLSIFEQFTWKKRVISLQLQIQKPWHPGYKSYSPPTFQIYHYLKTPIQFPIVEYWAKRAYIAQPAPEMLAPNKSIIISHWTSYYLYPWMPRLDSSCISRYTAPKKILNVHFVTKLEHVPFWSCPLIPKT